jgi:hypothetical protein
LFSLRGEGLRTVDINFDYGDKVIAKALHDLVAALRRDLLKKYDRKIQRSEGRIHNDNQYFEPKTLKRQEGGGSVARQ